MPLRRLVDAGASVTVDGHHKFITKTGPFVRFDKQQLSAETLASLREVKDPAFLHFKGCCFAPGALKPIDGMTNVVQLVGDGAVGDDAVLSDLSALPGLEELVIVWSDATARGLAFLQSAKHLQRLRIGGNGIDDRVLALIAGHEQLSRIAISSTSITGDGLRHLSGLPWLSEVKLGNCPITDDGLRHLHDLPRLGYLGLGNCPLTDAGLGYLAGLENLRTLALDRTRVTGVGFEKLRALRNLRNVVPKPRAGNRCRAGRYRCT